MADTDFVNEGTARGYGEDSFHAEFYGEEVYPECEICGDPIDFCIGHGDLG